MNNGFFKLSKELTYKLNSLPRGRLYDNINNTCLVPKTDVTIDKNSDCFLCFCDGFLPIPIGKILDFDTIEDLFNSQTAKIIQTDVNDRKFTWCAVEHCGIVDRNMVSYSPLDIGYYMSLNLDESCNLACPSCRREKIMISSGPEFNKKTQEIERIIQWLDRTDKSVYITLSGNGDPLASHIYRSLIKKWDYIGKHYIELKTNGLLVKKQLSNSKFLDSVDRFSISIDAGSKEVYEDVRRPGKWEVLLENLDFIKECKKDTIYNFVLQKNNFRDLENCHYLAKKHNANVNVIPMSDWGTWTYQPTNDVPDDWTVKNGFYVDQDVLNHENPFYNECKEYIQHLIDNKVIERINPYISEHLGLTL